MLGAMGADCPLRSPALGTACPLLLTRALTTTWGNSDSLAPGDMAMLSSSTKSTGRSLTCLRTMASGMREPSAGRAKMNTASVGATAARPVKSAK